MAIQFPHPETGIAFDFNQEQAIATRRLLLDRATVEKILVAGTHIPFPGIGQVNVDQEGGYSWYPVK